MTEGPIEDYAGPMRLLPTAVTLLIAAALAPAAAGQGKLTTESLRARSPLARALGARVGPPVPEPGEVPAWRRVLTPRNASGLFTTVVGDDLSTAEFDLRSTHGLRGVPPFVTLSPGVNLLTPDGPVSEKFAPPGADAPGSPGPPDLPARLWGVNAELMAFMPLSERWSAQAAVAPGLFTDFENVGGDAFRLPGRVLGIYKHSERTQLTVGAVYLDREDVTWLPALGLIHRPTDRTALELILPRPRVVHRLTGADADNGLFGYVAGELGGGSWAVRRDDGRDDVATLSDLRLLIGLEGKGNAWGHAYMRNLFAETGYVFNRSVEYASGVGDAEFDGAWLFRVGLRK